MGSISSMKEKRMKLTQKKSELNVERFQPILENILQSNQGKLFMNNVQDSEDLLNTLTQNYANVIADPVVEYEDTLRAQGLRKAQIRKLTSNWYCTYINSEPDARDKEYDAIVEEVAIYVYQHRELYSTINIDAL